MEKQNIVKCHLWCNLTEKEVLTKSKKAAEVVAECGNLQEQLAATTSLIKVKVLEAERDQLLSAIHLGKEVRDVDCQWFDRVADGETDLVRTDTHEVVTTKPLPKQQSLPKTD